jgi:hypothetical protein
MDRERFELLLDAYGADFRRWPAELRAHGKTFVAQHPDVAGLLVEAGALDRVLHLARNVGPPSTGLAARILAQAPRGGFDRRAMFALAACAIFGVVLGYGGALLAPAAENDAYFTMAFEAPPAFEDEG